MPGRVPAAFLAHFVRERGDDVSRKYLRNELLGHCFARPQPTPHRAKIEPRYLFRLFDSCRKQRKHRWVVRLANPELATKMILK